MNKGFVNKILPFVCAFSIALSLTCVPVGAVGDDGDLNKSSITDSTAFRIVDLLVGTVADFYSDVIKVFSGELSETWGDNWALIPRVANAPNPHFYTEDVLFSIVHDWNRNYMSTETYKGLRADVAPFADTGYYCIRLFNAYGETSLGPMICLTEADHGPILYDPSSGEEPKDPEAPGADSYNIWIPEDNFHSPYRLLDYEDLYNLAHDVGADVAWNDVYYYIYRDDGQLVYADSSALPYAAIKDKNGHASQNDRPVIDDPEDEIDDDFDAKIDLENGVINLPDGTLAFLDAVIYDESTKTYYVDSHDVTNNYYYFHYEYHINYTSITYIGQTEEYKNYEVYYKLPDGRDSADLTKEDLEQLNLSIDVIPYGRSTDNTSLRSLYHFDGDTRDASYWNYSTDFVWNEGASLTYMESGAFEGALYLDENEHEFTLQLPSDIGSGDFTLQYRIYQSHTAAPVTDSYISFGSVPLLQWSGGYWLDPDDTALHVTPTGTWNEVALIRDSGTVYYYLNGVCMGSYTSTAALNDHITFFFGDEQQTFKHLDELRVLDYALVEGGASYAPTAVPHDTNLALVVPTDAVPVADEYWSFTPDENAIVTYDFSTGVLPEDFIVGFSGSSRDHVNVMGSSGVDVESFSRFTRFTGKYASYSYSFSNSRNLIFIPVRWENAYNEYGAAWGSVLTFSIILADGSIYSVSSTMQRLSGKRVSINIPGGVIGFDYDWSGNSPDSIHTVAYIGLNSGKVLDVLYAELVLGDSTDLSSEWVESIIPIDKDSLNTPTLAVRTDLDITSYQIGGVRPSVPEKGMVWAMVENQRITSLQIYNGQAWEGVDGRIWTGSRWIPASSYNIITLQDMYDIVDATPNYEYIYSESGFWAWWQKSWNAFTERLFAALGNGQGVAGGLPADQLPAVPDDDTTEEDEGWSVIELLVVLRDGTWKVITGTVSTAFDGFTGFVSSVSNAGGFFEMYDSKNPDGIFGTTYGEDDLWHQ